MTERYDYFLLMLWVVVLTLGYVMVASALLPLSSAAGGIDSRIFKHGAFLALGLIAFFVALGIPLRIWNLFHQPAMAVALLVCLLVLVPGIGELTNGSRRWIGIGPVSLQASEASKFLVILYLAGYLARHQEDISSELSSMLRPLVVISLVCGLLLFEPDYGTVVVLSLVTGGMLFVAGAKLRHYLLVALAAVGTLSLISIVQPYRLERLISFLDPWSAVTRSGYQLAQSLIAFGRGDVFGLGLGEGVQKLFYLPEAHNDFIFAVICEELGLAGGIAVILVLTLVVLRVLRVARLAIEQGRNFEGLFVYGIAILFAVQSFINIGVSTGMLPTKGLTLPFISYGGNSLLISSLMMGIVFRVQFECASIKNRV